MIQKKPSLGEQWKAHQAKWKACTKCQLCDHRKHTSLYKGSIPCDVLLIGEGPGASEDVFGKPFVGPSGLMLEDQLMKSGLADFRLGFTNMVACIPRYMDKDEGVLKTTDPKPKEMATCSERIVELWKISQPKFVVFVGNLSKKYLPGFLKDDNISFDWANRSVAIVHPGLILRLDGSQKPLAIQSNIVTLGQFADKVSKECDPVECDPVV